MLVVLAVLLSLAAVPLTGGRLSRLAGVRLAGVWLVLPALAVQVLVISVIPSAPRLVLAAAHLGTYAMVAAVLVRNRRLPGLPVVAAGGLLNAVGISANGGTLPASAAAVARAVPPAHRGGFNNSSVLAHPHLRLLGDVFATPSWLPAHNVFSVGDVLIAAGVAWLMHRTCRPADVVPAVEVVPVVAVMPAPAVPPAGGPVCPHRVDGAPVS